MFSFLKICTIFFHQYSKVSKVDVIPIYVSESWSSKTSLFSTSHLMHPALPDFHFQGKYIKGLKDMVENTLLYTIIIHNLLFNYHACNDGRTDLTQCVLTETSFAQANPKIVYHEFREWDKREKVGKYENHTKVVLFYVDEGRDKQERSSSVLCKFHLWVVTWTGRPTGVLLICNK